MKRTSPLWGSISILIGVVIAILSLLRGNWATAALIAAFTVWGLWLIFTVSASPMTGRKPLRTPLTTAWGWCFCAM